jgi:internalin A
LAGNNLVSLPAFITQLPNLEYLDLYDNTLSNLPDSIAQLTSLKRLDLSHNLFTFLPDSIGFISNLNDLYLGYNRLMELPDSIARLSKLQSLSLMANPGIRISHIVGKLTQLTHLDIRHNQISILHENFCKLINLQHFDLSHNRISQLPECIGRLNKLVFLNINYNHVIELPESFANLSLLQSLYLSDNLLEQVPMGIARLNNLSCLILSSNHLQEVPEFLSKLTKLSHLDLSNNNITEIPKVVRDLPLLTHIQLSNKAGKFIVSSNEDIRLVAMLRDLKFEETCLKKLIDERMNLEWEINQFDSLYLHNLGDLIAEVLELRIKVIKDDASIAKTEAVQNYQNFLLLQQEQIKNMDMELGIAGKQQLTGLFHKAANLCNPCKMNAQNMARAEVFFKALNKAYLHQDIKTVEKICQELGSDQNFASLDYLVDGVEELQKKIACFQRLNSVIRNKIHIILKHKTYQRIAKINDPFCYFESQRLFLNKKIKELLD